MSKRIDHAAEAERLLDLGEQTHRGMTTEEIQVSVQAAQAHATLALVEQQRIANLVEMAQSPLFNAYDGSNPALDALMAKEGGILQEVAAALRIKEEK